VRALKLILSAIGNFARNAWSLPQAIASALSQRKDRAAQGVQETERLDRIRNPWKYRGK